MTRQEQNEAFLRTSFLYGANAPYIEELYARFRENPESVDESWRSFFARLPSPPEAAEAPSWQRASWPPSPANVETFDADWGGIADRAAAAVIEKAKAEPAPRALSSGEVQHAARDSIRAIMMIRAYRARGHLHADLDPLKLRPEEPASELEPESYGFTTADFSRPIFIDNYLGLEFATIPQMLELLKRTYCSTLGIEFMHVSDPEAKAWLQERIEGPDKTIAFTPEGKKAILNKLVQAEGFEKFLDVKYTGTRGRAAPPRPAR